MEKGNYQRDYIIYRVWLKHRDYIQGLIVYTKLFLCRIQIVKEGKKRKLVINGAKMEDAGKITAKTNADETSCDLGVKRKLITILDYQTFC